MQAGHNLLSNLYSYGNSLAVVKTQHAILCLTALLITMPAIGHEADVVVITSVNLVDVESGQIVPDTTVVIRGDEITSVGNTADTVVPPSAESIDGSGGYLIPGLWDVHVHLSYQRESALLALVANGVTSVRDTGSILSEIEAWRGQIA